MNSDGDKIYMKIVAFDEIYNFVLSTFFIWSHLVAKKRYTTQISIFGIQIWVVYHFFPASRWLFGIQIWVVYDFFRSQAEFKWKKMNYKVIHLVERYDFYINLCPSKFIKESYGFLETYWTLPPCGTTVGGVHKSRTTRQLEHCIWYGVWTQTASVVRAVVV
jgi:hypothetical protein